MIYNSNGIIEFIFRRWRNSFPNAADIWNNGNCYWFARILTDRFPYLKIYYNPIEGHFIAGDGVVYYDITGYYKSEHEDKYVLFEDLEKEDSAWFRRLIENCVL